MFRQEYLWFYSPVQFLASIKTAVIDTYLSDVSSEDAFFVPGHRVVEPVAR
jgi:hypothetical protein